MGNYIKRGVHTVNVSIILGMLIMLIIIREKCKELIMTAHVTIYSHNLISL